MKRYKLYFVIFIVFLFMSKLGLAQTTNVAEPVSFLMAIPKATTNGLPDCLAKTEGVCTKQLFSSVDIIYKKAGRALFTVYHKTDSGLIYRAFAARLLKGSNYVWFIQGQHIWRQLLIEAKNLMGDSTGVIGPQDFTWLATQSKTVCEFVSNELVIDLTDGVGNLKPIPDKITEQCSKDPDTQEIACELITTQRTYPAGFTYRCADGKYYGRLSKHGLGRIYDYPPTNDNYGTPVTFQSPTGVLTDIWDDPPIPTTKTCHGVPMATQCPGE